LEVILALSLSLGLVAGILALYRHATNIRYRVTQHTEMVVAERVTMDRITNELRGAMVYPFLNFGMEGSDRRIQFITAKLPGPSVWAVRKSTEDPIPPETDLELVGYRLRGFRNESGECVIHGLMRTSQKILAAPTAEEGKEIKTVLLTPHIRFLDFRYFDGNEWVSEWTEGGLPLAVEITMGHEQLPEDMEAEDYAEHFETFRRVVHVPGGQSSASGTILRGLGRGNRR
jgi:type II secretory pathway component PulJ